MPLYRNLTRKDWAMMVVLLAVFVAVLLIAAVLMAEKHLTAFLLLAGVLLLVLVHWHAANFAYRCPACANEFEVSTLRDLVSPHMGAEKYLRCPRCGNRSWATVLKKVS